MSRRELEDCLLSYQQAGGDKQNGRCPVDFDKRDLRRKAEERLRHAAHDVSKMTVPEIQELVHDLQVHQVELEMMVEELRSSRADVARAHGQYRELYEDAPVGYLTLDADETIVRANATAGAMLQRSVEQLQGKRLSSLAVSEDRDSCYLYVRKVMQGKAPQTADIRFQRLDDGQIIHVRLSAMRAAGGRATPRGEWRVGMMDITRAKQAELALRENEHRLKILNENLESLVVLRTEQVRALSTALTLAEQRERKRFSHVLHDDLQQKILGARLLFKQHLRDLRAVARTEMHDDVMRGIAVLDKAVRTARSLAVELNPPVLSTEGLDRALCWLASHMRKNYGLDVELRLSGPVQDVRNETQLMLTQMARELLNNVNSHAGVTECLLEASYADNQVRIGVADTGRGFDPREKLEQTADESHLGLFSIRERLRLFGGNLAIESAPGQGTRVTIHLPYGHPQPREPKTT